MIIPQEPGLLGVWSFSTKGSASTIPQVRDTFDAMLEQNGWWQDEIDGTYRNTMSVYGRKAPFSILDGVAINYVHELQQALRLCGLKDLADNFKI